MPSNRRCKKLTDADCAPRRTSSGSDPGAAESTSPAGVPADPEAELKVTILTARSNSRKSNTKRCRKFWMRSWLKLSRCARAGRRVLNMRHFDVQLIGGMVQHKGMISEMKTGEGKTLVATLPVYLNALSGRACMCYGQRLSGQARLEWMGRSIVSWG